MRLKSWNSCGASALMISRDLVEDEAQLLLGALGGAHLDHMAQGAHVRGPDDVGAEADRRQAAQGRGDLLLDGEGQTLLVDAQLLGSADLELLQLLDEVITSSRTGSSAGGTRKPMSVSRT